MREQTVSSCSVLYRSSLRMDFTDKVVVITGASSGIGAACAFKFAQLHAKLSLIGRNEENLRKVAQKCEGESGSKPLYVTADLTKEKDIEKIVEKTLKHHGTVDVLVNNAGISRLASIQSDISDYDSIMATNVRGPYLLTKKIIPCLVETKGSIVNISSILGIKGVPAMTPYCMSKAALDMFTKCVALEFACKGVRVNSVNPGLVKTEIFRRAGMTDEEVEKLHQGVEAATPLRKVSQGDDIAELVAFLASDKASCITGVSHIIDCGFMLGDTGNVEQA